MLRRRAGHRDGRPVYADVLGELLSADGTALVVRRADGTTVHVPAAEVHRVRTVPPDRTAVFALEKVAARGWPATDTARLGDWLLRATAGAEHMDVAGWTRRTSSALLVGDPSRPTRDALAVVRGWYAERGLPARLTIPLPAMAAVDHVAGELGFAVEADSEVLVRPVPPIGPGPPVEAGPGVRLDRELTDAWAAAYQVRPVPPVARRVITGPDQVVFASIEDGGVVVAIARGVVTDGWLGVAAVEVRPEHRRRGLAGRIVRGLFGWGAGQGATRCHLQVEAGNDAAQALYEGLGFSQHHRYRLRVSPPG